MKTSKSQRFRFDMTPDGGWRVRPLHNDVCAGLAEAAPTGRRVLRGVGCEDSPDQSFRLFPA